jgi:hypothetical protein
MVTVAELSSPVVIVLPAVTALPVSAGSPLTKTAELPTTERSAIGFAGAASETIDETTNNEAAAEMVARSLNPFLLEKIIVRKAPGTVVRSDL